MIRKWQSEDTAPLLSLWLESTTEAHPFIDASYWQANEAVVRDEYLPAAETWVWEENGTLCGFISVMPFPVRGGVVYRPGVHRKGDRACAAEPRSAALSVFNSGGVSEKRAGGEFLSCSGFSHRRQRLAG